MHQEEVMEIILIILLGQNRLAISNNNTYWIHSPEMYKNQTNFEKVQFWPISYQFGYCCQRDKVTSYSFAVTENVFFRKSFCNKNMMKNLFQFLVCCVFYFFFFFWLLLIKWLISEDISFKINEICHRTI